jgi:glucose/arabinose dehydrogenase
MRTVLSDFGNTGQGPAGTNPGGVALGPGGVILVADTEAGTGGAGTLFSIDPVTGARTVLSNFGVIGQGATGTDPFFVAVAASGAILVTDDDAGTDIPLDGQVGGNGALFTVNPTNGNRTLLSDFGTTTQGPIGVHPVGVAIVPLIRPGDALVIDFLAGTNGAGALFSVNPATGNRTLVSDFGNPMQGPGGSDPIGVALGTAGDILVADEDGVICGNGALFRVNPTNGVRTLLSNFCSAAQGPTGENPHGVALEADGNILVTDRTAGIGISGALFRVNPLTGARILLSDFGDVAQGPVGRGPTGVVPDASGDILAIDPDFDGTGNGVLFRVNPTNGMRTVLSDFNNLMQGPTGREPEDVTLDAAGNILVTDATAGTGNKGTLFRVNSMTGTRAVLSDFGNAGQGPTGQDIEGVVVEATGDILVIDDVTGLGGAGTLFRVNPANGMRTVVSDFGSAAQGPVGAQPVDVAIFSINSLATAPLNHFLCYRIKGSLGHRCTLDSPNPRAVCDTEEDCGGTEDVTTFCERFRKIQLPPRIITLGDQFEAGLFTVQKPVSLCNPADKEGEDPTAPDDSDHFGAYQIALVPKICAAGAPTNEGKACQREQDCGGTLRQTSFCQRAQEHVRPTDLTVENQFGSLQVDTIKPDRLLVPTAKSLSSPAPAPTPGLDHFKCYSVRVTPGTPKFPKDLRVSVVDQFHQPTLYDVVKPTRLCAPANKDDESPGAETHPMHLMCYQVKPAVGQPKHVKVSNIYTNNQFGPDLLDTIREEELCVPSRKTLP